MAKQREQDPTNLYFANLPQEIDETMLNDLLKNKFNASVVSTRIMREKSGNSKCVGFARIEDNEMCEKIVQELNGRLFPGKNSILKKIISLRKIFMTNIVVVVLVVIVVVVKLEVVVIVVVVVVVIGIVVGMVVIV